MERRKDVQKDEPDKNPCQVDVRHEGRIIRGISYRHMNEQNAYFLRVMDRQLCCERLMQIFRDRVVSCCTAAT